MDTPDSATLRRFQAHAHSATDLYNARDCVGAAAQLLAALRTAPALADALFSDEELLLADDPDDDDSQSAPVSANMTMAELMNVEAQSPTLQLRSRHPPLRNPPIPPGPDRRDMAYISRL